jgi:hypothetical protein
MNLRFVVSIFAALLVNAIAASAATFTVVSTSNEGPGSFREAIRNANNTAGDDIITFDLPGGGPHVIDLTTELPALTSNSSIINDRRGDEAVTIERSTASGTNQFGLLTVSKGKTVLLAGLTLANGYRLPNSFNVDFGGAVDARGATLTMRNCTVSGNSADCGGGVAVQSATITNCTFAGNIVGQEAGGGLNIDSGSVTNCTFSGNTEVRNRPAASNQAGPGPNSGSGGPAGSAIAVGHSLTIKNCTFTGNTDEFGFGAVYTDYGTITIGNSLFNGPSVSTYTGHFVSLGHNLTSDGGAGAATAGSYLKAPSDRGNINPRVAGLQRNGGFTATHALLPDSPAIDSGDDSIAPAKDQRGFGRRGTSDIGAFEFHGVAPTRLANISTRLQVGTGDHVLIGGFIVSGTDPKTLILRAIGPSLNRNDCLGDPKLEIYDAAGGLIASNDDWQSAPNKQAIIDSGIAPSNPVESVVLRTFDPGLYTAIVRGVNKATGLALVEVYDPDPTANATLANISTRGFVQTGDKVLIGGVIILGPDPQRVLVRALGPSLPKPEKLADPTLELYDSDGTLIAQNDNWRTDEAEVQATGLPPKNDAESAIVRTLAPGSYTAIARGKNGGTGLGLVEVYALE